MSDIFRLLTPVTYWILIVLWSFILCFYVQKMWKSKTKHLFLPLLIILAIDAFRTLFESVYFGLWYTSLSGIGPQHISTFLMRPEMVIVPKIVNVIAAIIVIFLLLKRWLPREEEEQKRAEKHLQESETRFRTIYENAPVLINAFDQHGNCVLWNKQCCETFGWTIDEINASGDALSLFYPDRAVRDEVMNSITIDPDGVFREWHPITKEGKTLTTLWANFKLTDGLMFSLGHDVTESKLAEIELKKHRDNLEKLVDERTHELRKVQNQLLRKEKMAAIGQLSGSVAHDIRNPLGAVSNSVYFLNHAYEDMTKELLSKHLKIMQKEISKASDIITDLMDFSRENRPALVKGDINSLIEDILERTIIPERITVETEMDPTLPLVPFDPSQIQRVVHNLIINAFQSMPQEGVLKISSSKRGDFVVFKIQDTGKGIKSEDVENIFEPLFTTKSKGVGLGLSIVKTFVEKHNGTIEIESEVGIGTTFRVSLPIYQEHNS